MRNRAWRRYKQECKILKRLAYQANLFSLRDSNDIYYEEVSLKNLLGTQDYFMYKTYTTSKHDSKFKTKYSPNTNSFYRDNLSKGRRETDRMEFIKLLKEYGLK